MSRAKSTAAPLISRGLPVVVGVVVSAWPGATVATFAVCALIAAGIKIMSAFNSDRIGPVAGCLLLVAQSLAGAFGSLTWRGRRPAWSH